MSETTPTGLPIVDCDTCGKRHPERRKHCQECGAPSRFINDGGLCLGCNKALNNTFLRDRVLCRTCGHPYVSHERPARAKDPKRLRCGRCAKCVAFVASDVSLPEEPNPGPRTPASWPVKPPSLTEAEREALYAKARGESSEPTLFDLENDR